MSPDSFPGNTNCEPGAHVAELVDTNGSPEERC
jgi:hypothetical protein